LLAPNLTATAFAPPWWLRSADLQTMLANLPPMRGLIQRRAHALCAQAAPWLLDCGDGVRLQAWYTPAAAASKRTALLLHGWEGSSESCYVLSAGALLLQFGYNIVRLNLRDHGGTQHLNRELFHSCRLPEMCGAIAAVAQRCTGAPLYLGGFSLGGNFLLRAAAAPAVPANVAGVVAVSPVLDPHHTLDALEGRLGIYQQYFVRRWTRSLRGKQRAWPQDFNFERLLRSRNLRQMTADLVAEHTEFADIDAYLEGYAITGARLSTLSVPARILTSADDPIIPASDLSRLAAPPLLEITRTEFGGHCGFHARFTGPSFADHYLLAQFAALG
jgi:predicted alpha/beta-fold hydrolase